MTVIKSVIQFYENLNLFVETAAERSEILAFKFLSF